MNDVYRVSKFPQAPFFVSDTLVIVCTSFYLVAMEKRVHLIPSRTQKLSSSSPMVLHTRVWKSRSPPSSFYFPLFVERRVGVFFWSAQACSCNTTHLSLDRSSIIIGFM